MGLNNLENKIRENKMFFDGEPSTDHLEKFQAKLANLEKSENKNNGFLFTSNRAFVLAASVTFFLLVAIFALLESPNVEAQPQLSEELMHVKMYYSAQTDSKMEEIRNCAAETTDNEMLFETAEDRLYKLDNNTQILEDKLEHAKGNKQLKNAYIQSLKAKSEVVDQIYTQLCEYNTNNIITQ
jgi:hypothetical protein